MSAVEYAPDTGGRFDIWLTSIAASCGSFVERSSAMLFILHSPAWLKKQKACQNQPRELVLLSLQELSVLRLPTTIIYRASDSSQFLLMLMFVFYSH